MENKLASRESSQRDRRTKVGNARAVVTHSSRVIRGLNTILSGDTICAADSQGGTEGYDKILGLEESEEQKERSKSQ